VAARVHAVSEVLLPVAVVNTAVRQHYTEFLCAMANDARWMVSHLTLLQLLEPYKTLASTCTMKCESEQQPFVD
jgi:hypothetical protein